MFKTYKISLLVGHCSDHKAKSSEFNQIPALLLPAKHDSPLQAFPRDRVFFCMIAFFFSLSSALLGIQVL